jgi:hypothetical protein
VYWFPKAVDLFGFPVDALWCTGFQRLLIYFAFLKPVHQRATTGKPNKSKAFGNQYIKEHQQESQINQNPLETSTSKSMNRKVK